MNQSPDIRLLIFDLDGTLIDSQQDLAAAVNTTRAQVALAPLGMAEVASLVGRGAPQLIRDALGSAVAEEDLDRWLRFFIIYYHDHALDHTHLYPGVEQAIEEFGSRILAVLTNKPVRISRHILTELGVAHRFRFIYGGNSFEQKKPDPVGVFSMLEDSGLEPEQAMIVGDSQVDVLTGRNAGVWTCGVTYGFQPDSFRENPPDLVVSNLKELASRLRDGWQPGKSGG